MATANKQFRAARERTESLAHPGYCLTRQELAELVNTYIWDHHKNKIVEASANYICQIELGSIRWPGKLYREAFRAIFGVSTDSALGFANTRSRRTAVKLDNVKRKQLIQRTVSLGVGALLGGPLAALLGDSKPTPIPARVGATDIAQIRNTTQVFRSWSFTYGGVPVRDAAMAQLHWSAGLLDATCPDRLRPELFTAVGALADTVAYTALDAGVHEEARRVFSFGLACAKQAEEWHLRATVLDSMVAQEIRAGQPDEALTSAEHALVRADRLTETEQAMLHTDRARALATMRRVQEALRAIGTADEHFAHANPANDPPYVAYYNAVIHAGHTGKALLDLAILGRDPGEATSRLEAAVAGLTTSRSRATCLAKLASLTMATGDPLQAVALGHQALDIASTLHSRMATEDLRELNLHAAAHQDLEEVTHLRHRIATLVCTGSP